MRELVLHRYAQYCNVVRGRLLIYQQKQSINIQDLDSGGRGRKFESSHPDQLHQAVTEFTAIPRCDCKCPVSENTGTNAFILESRYAPAPEDNCGKWNAGATDQLIDLIVRDGFSPRNSMHRLSGSKLGRLILTYCFQKSVVRALVA